MIAIAFGTRPEWIKIEPIIEKIHNKIPYILFCTGQHEQILGSSLKKYKHSVLSIKNHLNRLDDIVVSILHEIAIYYNSYPEISHVLVQGDTTSAFAVALSAFHRKIPIIHLEAGLRSWDIFNPYPEEFNRVSISNMASIHLCPTQKNMYNLAKCPGVKYVTGNTVLDKLVGLEPVIENFALITMHRRENLNIIDKWFEQLDLIASENTHLEFIFPMHPNPEIQKHRGILKHVKVVDPVSHDECIDLIRRCSLVITDSGGIQEESSFLKKKCIVCRETTERGEGEGTFASLCCCPDLLPQVFKNTEIEIVNQRCPYGDGHASDKIYKILKEITSETIQ